MLPVSEPPLEARAMEHVRAGQPLVAAPDRLLADDALFAFGGEWLTRSAWYASTTGMASLLTEVGAGAGTATFMNWPASTA